MLFCLNRAIHSQNCVFFTDMDALSLRAELKVLFDNITLQPRELCYFLQAFLPELTETLVAV